MAETSGAAGSSLPAPSLRAAWDFCERILVDVSRSFALIIPKCPPPLDRCLCVGYLLCRLADTIEDDDGLTSAQRNHLYDTLLDCIHTAGDADSARQFVETWPHAPKSGYGELVRGTQAVVSAFTSLPGELQTPIVLCIDDMVAGMRSMRPVDQQNGLTFYCRDLNDLDRYCHHVAGTVGIMSTELFEHYLTEHRRAADSIVATNLWREQGRRMGLGLQMTNIIKDACTDATRGVSFVPPRYIKWQDQTPRLTDTGRADLIRHTLAHLDEAIQYTTAFPADQIGIRTFLLGSILPAVATLEIAAAGQTDFPKINRTAMSALLAFVETSAADNEAIRIFYNNARERCVETLRITSRDQTPFV